MSEWSIPDAIEEVVGYRAWMLTDDGELRSTANYGSWKAGHNEALCFDENADSRKRRYGKNVGGKLEWIEENTHGLIPEPTCNCGFWLLDSPESVQSRFLPQQRKDTKTDPWTIMANTITFSLGPSKPAPLVIGKAKGWGRVVVGENGWRCEFAEIVELFEAKNPKLLSGDDLHEVADRYNALVVRNEALDYEEPKKPERKPANHYDHVQLATDIGAGTISAGTIMAFPDPRECKACKACKAREARKKRRRWFRGDA